jgi:cell division protein FtsB
LSTHAHFEELCVLATSGQLSTAESDALNQHLLECDICRGFLKDAHIVSDRVLPRVLRASRGETRVPAGIREHFLARATSEGFQIHAGPPVVVEAPIDYDPRPQVELLSRWSPIPRVLAGSLRSWQTWTIVVSACIACFALGAFVRIPSPSLRYRAAISAAPATTALTPAPFPGNTQRDRMRALTAERDQLARQITDLSSQLETASNERGQTNADLQQKLSAVQSDATRDHYGLEQQLATLSARTVDLQSQLDTARQQQSLADEDLRSTRTKNLEYSARLDLLQTQIRNQEATPLPNADEISSLVAARNLHIIDVYDSNAAGKRQRAFGRVFYVEGRSLVFYAYDLTAAHGQKNITFHLWGEKAGSKEATLSLGILHDDDPRERRWTLTFDDPQVLAKINSVYVTAESASKQGDAPLGPRVLYAYFGAQPNHP